MNSKTKRIELINTSQPCSGSLSFNDVSLEVLGLVLDTTYNRAYIIGLVLGASPAWDI